MRVTEGKQQGKGRVSECLRSVRLSAPGLAVSVRH